MSDHQATDPAAISIDLARRLNRAGLEWQPQSGDRFHIPDRGLDDRVFAISEMVVQVRDVVGGERELAFNGTVEWALDAIVKAEVVWLPDEGRLRTLLGDRFFALYADDGGYICVLLTDGLPHSFTGRSAAEAYGAALLFGLADDGKG
jgi:hypothetical protein